MRMSMGQKKLFIFDLDGTLADAYTAIWKSLNFTLRKLNYPRAGFQKVKINVGRGDRAFMEVFFSNKDVDKALAVYRLHHEKALRRYSRARPYAKRLLGFLRKKEMRIAIASNRPRYFTDVIMKKTGLKKFVDYILCADQINSPKPDPLILRLIMRKFNVKKKETVYAGDMDIDLETASRAGVDAIFVRGGSSRLSDIKKYKNVLIVSSLNWIISS